MRAEPALVADKAAIDEASASDSAEPKALAANRRSPSTACGGEDWQPLSANATSTVIATLA